MSKQQEKKAQFYNSLANGRDRSLSGIISLQEIVTNFKFEGKASVEKNLKQAKRVIEMLDGDLTPHLEMEEMILFSYVEKHIPKLEILTVLLRKEHENFRKTFREFKYSLWELSDLEDQNSKTKAIQRIYETGDYLAHLFQARVYKQSEILYRILEKELKATEKTEIVRRLEEWQNMFLLSKQRIA